MINSIYKNKEYILAFVLASLFSNVKIVNAQQIIAPTQQPLPSILDAQPLKPKDTSTPDIKLNPNILPSQIPNDSTEKIKIKAFSFKGNTIFSNEELNKLGNSYIGREITFIELNTLIESINKKYIDGGFITSGAYIPGIINNTRVRFDQYEAIIPINIVEGKIQEIRINGNKYLEKPVRRVLKNATYPVLNQNKLIEATRLLQSDPKIKRISVSIEPGTETGQSILEANVDANNPLSAFAILDNDSNKQVGSLRRGLIVNSINLTGIGDTLNFNFLNTDGSNQIGIAYNVPFDNKNSTIGFEYNRINNKIINTPFKVLDINSESQKFDLTYRRPIFKRADQNSISELSIGTILSYEDSKSIFLGGIPLPSPGANASGKTEVIALRFFQEYSKQTNNQVFSERIQVNVGLPILSNRTDQGVPDSNFVSLNLESSWTQRLPQNFQLYLQGGAQIANGQLVPLEQVSLGGFSTIIGNQPSSLRADSAFWGSGEILRTISLGKIGELQAGVFISGGLISNYLNNDLNQNTQTSSLNTGIEIKLRLLNRLFARLTWATPILSSSQQSFLQDNGISFSILCKIY